MIKMFDRTRRLRLLLAVLVMASVTIITLDFRSGGDGPLDKVGRAAMTVIGPVQDGLSTLLRPVGNFFAGFTQVPSLRERIRSLETELAVLTAEPEQIVDITRENERLRELVALQERFGFSTIGAQVIGVGASNFERTVFIDRGRADGIEVDMPVLGGPGLIGRVASVGRTSARVILLTDRRSSVAARVGGSGETGIVEGNGTAELILELLDPDAEVAVGDRIVTSGYDRALYPAGVLIGTVIEAPEADADLSRVVTAEPAVDFSALDYVLVVTEHGSGARGSRRGGDR